MLDGRVFFRLPFFLLVLRGNQEESRCATLGGPTFGQPKSKSPRSVLRKGQPNDKAWVHLLGYSVCRSEGTTRSLVWFCLSTSQADKRRCFCFLAAMGSMTGPRAGSNMAFRCVCFRDPHGGVPSLFPLKAYQKGVKKHPFVQHSPVDFPFRGVHGLGRTHYLQAWRSHCFCRLV